ncbi:MAG: hypothetical protein Q4615_06280 [Paracoccus aminovorans]|nr:hypothetical protein [Paracoccus aminovorans]
MNSHAVMVIGEIEGRRHRDAQRKKGGNRKFERLVEELVDTIRLAFQLGWTGSIWGLEGTLRHGVRARYCLAKWKWSDADALARDAVAEAYRRIGAKRPDWNEGQPEWTIEGGALVERTRCARCHMPLPEGHHKYCGKICRNAHYAHIARIKNADEDGVLRLVIESKRETKG